MPSIKVKVIEKIIAVISISLIFITPLIILKKLKTNKNVNINVVETKQIEQKNSKEGNKTFKIKGKITGILLEQDYPNTIVEILDSKNNLITSVTPNFKGIFETTFKANEREDIIILAKNQNYVFYPQKILIKTNKETKIKNLNFEAALSQTAAQNLQIKGSLKGLKNKNALVYLIGLSVVTKKEVKKIAYVNKQGDFLFTNIDSGTYVLIPYSKNMFFLPKSKEVNLKNTNKKVIFWSIRKIY